MSETGQPGAATPGEHGDGTGQHDDLARPGSGWASAAAAWSPEGEAGSGWQPEPQSAWSASAPRYGDLPPPLPGHHPGDGLPTRANGHRVNGYGHGPTDAPGERQVPISAPPGGPRIPVSSPPSQPQHPVSAPPGMRAERRRDHDTDRVVVPFQRPSPPTERPTGRPPVAGDPPNARHSSDASLDRRVDDPRGDHRPERDQVGRDTDPTRARGADPTRARDTDPTRGRGTDPTRDGPSSAPPARRLDDDEPDWPGPNWNRPSWSEGWAPPWARTDEEPTGRRGREERDPPERVEWAPHPEHLQPTRQPEQPLRPSEQPTRPSEQSTRPPERTRPQTDRRPPADPSPRPYEPMSPEVRRLYEPPPADPAPPYDPDATQTRRPYDPTAGESRQPYDPAAGRTPRPYEPTPAAEHRPYEPVSAEEHRPYQPMRSEPNRYESTPPEAWRGYPPSASRIRSPEVGERPPWALGGAPEDPTGAPGVGAQPPEEPTGVDTGTPDAGALVRPFRLRPVRTEPEPLPAEPADGPVTPQPPTRPLPPADQAGPVAVPTTGVDDHPDRRPSAPEPESAAPYSARRSAPEPAPAADPDAEDRAELLPQRVPAEPDVPVVPEPPTVEPTESPELARIATHLRREEEPDPPQERPEGFDVEAILAAVRGVGGVRDASLRRTPAGAHSLRLDLSDGADPADVSRHVARLLQERMGLAAAPQNLPAPPVPPGLRSGTEARPVEGQAPPTPPVRPEHPTGGATSPVPAGAPSPAGFREDRPTGPAPSAPPRRRRQTTPSGTQEPAASSAATGMATGSPALLGSSYSGGQMTTTETAPSRPLDTGGRQGPRVVIDHVQVSTFGLDATVEVRLLAAGEPASGFTSGPAVDGYVLRLCAVAAAAAVDELLRGTGRTADSGRCFVEHAAVVPFGNCEVATVVVLLVCDGWVEQIAGSALVQGDPRQAVVRATLAAVNRRLEALLA
ncbi:hypothetical protein [Micromonospora sp. SH-82]|uniref:hypothetical protein n=1 Tax=Micromonospora sp. SH-82 TaxID=3132938 RepID=UPI003EBC2C9C